MPSIVDLCNAIESSQKPFVAAIRGIALGGGCELALSCHFRVGDLRCGVGLPEVKIGVIPGAGGTQRLPRLCGVEFALKTITSGKIVGAKEARKVGLIDGVLGDGGPPGETLEQCAHRWASYAEVAAPLCMDYCMVSRRSVLGEISSLRKLCDEFTVKLPPMHRGGEAVRGVVKAIRASFECANFKKGMEAEERIFTDLVVNSSQGRALRHAFFSERAAKSRRDTDADKKGGSKLSLRTMSLLKDSSKAGVGVIGAGTMGSGIAVSFLRAGFSPVFLVDNNAKGLGRGVELIKNIIQGDVEKKRFAPEKAQKMVNSLKPVTDLGDLKHCALVVEAVFENLEIKKSIFRKLDDIASPDALLLSNTSTLDVNKIASALSPSRRDKCAGMHFFSPAHIMKLVEIVRSSSTSEATLDVIRSVTKRLDKVGVTVGNCDGFVGNRMLFPYTSEMVFLVLDGKTSVAQVDTALFKFGMALGPFAMSDLAGNDIGYNIRMEKGLVTDVKTNLPGPNRKPGMRYSELADELITKLGRAGQKVGKGWYDYDPKKGKGRRPMVSEEVSKMIASYANKSSPSNNNSEQLNGDEIVQRLLYPLVNEAFKILDEGIASDPADVDVIYLYGYGFPSWRGGPLYWADNEVGLPSLLRKLEEFHNEYSGSVYYQPSDLLRKCVKQGVGVQEFYRMGLNKESSHRSKL